MFDSTRMLVMYASETGNESVLSEAARGDCLEWSVVQLAVLKKLGVTPAPGDVSPASTVQLPLDSLKLIDSPEQMRDYIVEAISAMTEAPICMQRLAEVVQHPRDDARFYRQVERIIASSSFKRLSAHPMRRRTSRGSDASSSSAYSISPKRRLLKRPRRFH